jgi:hypothetical protein
MPSSKERHIGMSFDIAMVKTTETGNKKLNFKGGENGRIGSVSRDGHAA